MNVKSVSAILISGILATCCVQESGFEDKNSSVSEYVPVKDGYVRLELATKSESKTMISSGQVVWETNDKISVFAGDNKETSYEFSLKSSERSNGTFEGEVLVDDAKAEEFVVAYPYNADISLEETVLSGIEIKAEQTLSAGSFGSGENPSVGKGGKTSLEFKNLGALIRIPVYGPVAVKQIIITAPENTVLAGKGSVDVESENLDFTISEGAANVVTLTAATAIDATSGVDFYAAVAPQGEGFTCDIKVILEDGSSMTKHFADDQLTRANARVTGNYIAYDAKVFYGSANCYIGKPGEVIEFDVTPYYMSGYETCSPTTNTAFTKDIVSADVVWKEEGLTGELEVSYAEGKVTVKGIAGAGNALVAIKDADGTILWSYHIWVPKSDPTQTLTYKMHSSYTLSPTEEIMPMNLGALDKTGADAYGCYYEWGRKDPLGRYDATKDAYIECGIDWANEVASISWFHTTTNANYGKYGYDAVLYGISNPTKYLRSGGSLGYLGNSVSIKGFWGNNSTAMNSTTCTKSVFDPCPAGYKVPQKGVFNHFLNDDETYTETLGDATDVSVSRFKITNGETAATDLGFRCRYGENDEQIDFYPLTGQRNNETGVVGSQNKTAIIWYSTPAGSISGERLVMNSSTKIVVLHQTMHSTFGCNVRCVKE